MKTVEERRKYNAEYYQRNRDRLLKRETERARQRYAANKEKKLASNKAWLEKNKDRHKALCADWERENAERRKTKRRAWYAKNKERVFLKVSARRSRLYELGGATTSKHRDYSRGFIEEMKRRQRGLCAACRRELSSGHHVDHIVPLVAGGDNAPSNLQLLCPPCNLSKGTKHHIDFMRSRGFLL